MVDDVMARYVFHGFFWLIVVSSSTFQPRNTSGRFVEAGSLDRTTFWSEFGKEFDLRSGWGSEYELNNTYAGQETRDKGDRSGIRNYAT